MAKKKHRQHHLELIDRMVRRADKLATAKKYRPRKHANALWELAMVQIMVLERLGAWDEQV